MGKFFLRTYVSVYSSASNSRFFSYIFMVFLWYSIYFGLCIIMMMYGFFFYKFDVVNDFLLLCFGSGFKWMFLMLLNDVFMRVCLFEYVVCVVVIELWGVVMVVYVVMDVVRVMMWVGEWVNVWVLLSMNRRGVTRRDAARATTARWMIGFWLVLRCCDFMILLCII